MPTCQLAFILSTYWCTIESCSIDHCLFSYLVLPHFFWQQNKHKNNSRFFFNIIRSNLEVPSWEFEFWVFFGFSFRLDFSLELLPTFMYLFYALGWLMWICSLSWPDSIVWIHSVPRTLESVYIFVVLWWDCIW